MFVSLARVATIPLDRVSSLYVRLLCPSELADTYTITHSSDSEQIVSHAAKHSFKLAYNLNDFMYKQNCDCCGKIEWRYTITGA